MASKAASVLKYVGVDLAGSVIHFPLWWYTQGALGALTWIRDALSYRWQSFGFAIWIKNFFTPMYGQNDWSGRLISVFMRFVVLIGRFIFFFVEALIYAALFVLWLLAPPVTLLLFLQSFSAGPFVSQVRSLLP